jgi:WXG100 family type VII secretion target
MDVETVREVHRKIMDTQQQMEALLNTMNSSVDGMQPAWLGGAATQFFELYNQWKAPTGQQVESLATMGSRLQAEITQWEETAAKLN